MRLVSASAAIVALALASPTRAQTATEPIKITFAAPPSCPNEKAFTDQVRGRTARARLASANEPARVFHVNIEVRGGKRHGTLRIEDVNGKSDVREVEGAQCADVVSALALIAALAIDPHASTAPVIAVPIPGAPPPNVSTEDRLLAPVPITIKTPWYAGISPLGSPDAGFVSPFPSWTSLLPYPLPALPSPARAPSFAISIGANFGVLTPVGPTATATVGAFVDVRMRERGPLTPSVRLSFIDGLDTTGANGFGDATFHFLGARLEACPVRLRLGLDGLDAASCAGITAGEISATGHGLAPNGLAIAFDGSANVPWVDVPILERVEFTAIDHLALDVEAGAVFPITRPSFRLEPDVVYAVPSAGFLASGGAAIAF